VTAGRAVLFFSVHTTLLLTGLRSAAHFPSDLLGELGEPAVVGTWGDVLERFGPES
jgi:hypothetical protein